MASANPRVRGFTLIEMMVTLAVIVVLLLIAVPSFQAFRQRAALRTASEQALSFWNQARLEAAKRNALVRVGVKASGGDYCLGASTTTLATETALCDCFTAGACDVAAFPGPGNQAQWNRVRLSKVTLGTSNYPTVATNKTVVIDPHLTFLTETGDAGVIQLAGPVGQKAYLLNLNVDPFGRATLCESTAAVDKMSDYGQRRCGP
jgi:prepilin-type N-terminal cleavage/methylation domain-containing protein